MPLPDTASLGRRHAQIRLGLDALGLDALVITAFPNIRYLSNHVGSAGILVLTPDGVHLLVDFRYEAATAAVQQSAAACPGLHVWPVPASYEEALLGCLTELGVARVGLEADHVTLARHEWLVAHAASRGLTLAFRSTTRLVEAARMVKDAAEIAQLRDAAARLAPVVEAAISAVRGGATERAVAIAIETAIRDAGY